MPSRNLLQTRGFLLVETLLYVVVMTILIGATSYFIFQTYQIYRDAISVATADRIGVSLINELVRETRSGVSIDAGASSIGNATGYVTINTPDSGTKYFAYDEGRIIYGENDGANEYLTPQTVDITTFLITQINTPVSYALRYEVGITFEEGSETVTKTYRGLATLRQSYE